MTDNTQSLVLGGILVLNYGSKNPTIAERAMIQNQLPEKELIRSRQTDKITFTLTRKLRPKISHQH